MNIYDPQKYWEKRLKSRFDLTGVGNIVFDSKYNEYLYKLQLDVLVKALRKYNISLREKKILDIGCGTGFFSRFYLNNLATVTGIDITTTSIETLKKSFPDGRFITLDISTEFAVNQEPFAGEFDIVNVLNVIFHIVDETKFEKALKNIAACLKEGGYLFISDYFGDTDVSPARHVKFRRLESYRILEQEGIKILEVMPIYHLMNKRVDIFSLRINNLISPILFIFDSILNKLEWLKGNDIKLLVGRKLK